MIEIPVVVRRLFPAMAALTLALAGGLWLIEEKVAKAADPAPVVGFLNKYAAGCPMADPGDVAAFERCRTALAGIGDLGRVFAAEGLAWGGDVAGKPLKDLTLTHFDPTVYVRLYLAVYMVEGPPRVTRDEERKLDVVELPVRFRNLLGAGEYPYPFWHSMAKWDAYQSSNVLRFYLQPGDGRIEAALRTVSADGAKAAINPRPAPKFDGHWVWDDHGTAQPQVSLFSAQFRPANPYVADLDASYRAFAEVAREGSCMTCHVPNNPQGAKRLVLLQTPMHASGEIRRALKDVAADKMPIEEWGSPKPLDPAFKRVFLEKGTAFADTLDKARAWEAGRARP